jgi:hypothetical protein
VTAAAGHMTAGRSAPVLPPAEASGPVQVPRLADGAELLGEYQGIVVTAWVLCVIPLLTFSIGYLVLHLPAVDRALWRSASLQAHLMTAAAAGHHYSMAAVDAIDIALVALPFAGSLYIVTGLARRLTALGRRWSAARPARRLPAAAAGLAVMVALAGFWTIQGQFRGW